MPLPQLTPASTGKSQLSNRWVVQVDTAGSDTTPTWVTVFGRKSFGPTINPTKVDNSDSDTGIWASQATVGLAWTAALVLEHKLYSGAEDVGQAFLRQAGAPTGVNAEPELVHVRWFDRFGGTEVYEGWASVSWVASTAEKDTDKVTVTLDGQGALYGAGDTLPNTTVLASPIATNSAPVVGSATPSGAAAGELVRISGSNFLGATQVKFGATNAADFDVSSNSTIVASMPAGTAGSAAITVINAVGTSNALPYTRA